MVAVAVLLVLACVCFVASLVVTFARDALPEDDS